MGLGEFLGVKQYKIEVKEKMTLEELYNKIKDIEFEAGKPEYVKHGFNKIIAFPAEDSQNQVWIIPLNKKTFLIERSTTIAGVKNSIKNDIKAQVLNTVTGGVSGMVSSFGAPKDTCMAHCDDVANKVKEMLSQAGLIK